RMEGHTAMVRKSKKKKAVVPSWMGGRMSLSSELSAELRRKMETWPSAQEPELKLLRPLFEIQAQRSCVPQNDELLIELFESREGYHLFVFPFEGRMVNEGMGMLFAYRLSQISAQTYSIAMNDYGFELLSSEPIPLEEALELDLFNTRDLSRDLQESTNYSLMCQRRFADIAVIGGLLFKGTQNKPVKNRHLQSSSRLIYGVFSDFEPDHVLLQQAREEVLTNQLEERRLRIALDKANQQELIIHRIQRPTPFSFPLMVDRLRETWSSEKLEDRIARMLNEAEDV
ncbi:MAG: DNA ligase-associated DEXH box helicase, partial [Bacteroidia bacterium]